MKPLGLTGFGLVVPFALSIGCGKDDTDAPKTPPGTPETCEAPESAGCWQEVEPPGRAVFPSDWQDGKWPQTLLPVVAFGDDIWMTNESYSWSTADGVKYTRHDKTDWQGRLSPNYVLFRSRLWLIGGMELVGSDFENGTFTNVVWSSADGVTWENAGAAAWPPRKSTAVAVHQDRLWIFGGSTSVAADGSNDEFLNDVWSTADGVTWIQATAAAPWPPRADAGVEVFNDELYVVGGAGFNDVWRSRNGADWTLVARNAEWSARNDNGTAVFDGKLWVFGGYVGDNRNAQNDVWFSTDGASFVRQIENAPWSPRSGAHNVVFQNKLWIFSGKHTGDDPVWQGDIWRMSAPGR
jgi:hypothetical protein